MTDHNQPGAVLADHARQVLDQLDQLADLLDTCRAGMRARITVLDQLLPQRQRFLPGGGSRDPARTTGTEHR